MLLSLCTSFFTIGSFTAAGSSFTAHGSRFLLSFFVETVSDPGSFFTTARGTGGAGVRGGLRKGSCLTTTGGEESRRSNEEALGDTSFFTTTAAGGDKGVVIRGGLCNGSCFTTQGGEDSRRSMEGGTVLVGVSL